MDSPIKWVGSKRLLKKTICNLIPEAHKVYVEPFAGSAAIFFFKNSDRLGNKPHPSELEVLNDIDGLLMNLYKIIQDPATFKLFLRRLSYSLVSRDFFMEYRASDWNTLDPVEKAFRVYYIVKTSYGGLFRFNQEGQCNSPIASSPDKKARSFLFKKKPLRDAHKRLRNVILHEMDYKEVIKMYDDLDAFFYMDPPYKTEYAYNKPFNHVELLNACRNIKGKFLLSLNSDFQELFSEFDVQNVDVNYSVTCKKGDNVKNEILVKNYE
ncbi:MAG: DNA adenine methylase [Candidatus Hodarchaeota archaeon]